MISKLFGNRNNKADSNLKITSKGKRNNRKKVANDPWGLGIIEYTATDEAWGTGATDALRVPILARAHDEHILIQDTTTEQLAQHSLQNPTNDSCSSNDSIFISSKTEIKTSGLGLYTKSTLYGEKMSKLLDGYGLDIEIFGPDSEAKTSEIDVCSAWIVDMSNEDDCPILDKLIDRCNEVPALFFFEQKQTKTSLEKLKGFIDTTGLLF